MAGLTVRIKADSSQFEKTVKGVKMQLGGLTTAVEGIGAAIGTVWASVKAFQAIGDALVDSSKKAAGMEMLQMQFETLTKSTETAKKLIQDFRTEAQKSPLTTRDYAQAAQKMLTVGKSADEIMPTLKMLGDVSMGNGLKFERLALAYSQVIAKGRLMGQENNQLAESGFNPLAQISKKTGESMATLMKRMEDGAISSGEVAEAFKDATSAGGLFFEAIQKGANTMEGKLANTRDTIDNLQIAFGTGMNEGIKVGLDKINEGLPQFQDALTELGSTFGTAIAEGVNGDFERLQSIGEMIGKIILSGASGVIQGAGTGLVNKWADTMLGANQYVPLPTNQIMAGIASKVKKTNITPGDVISANVQNAIGTMRQDYAGISTAGRGYVAPTDAENRAARDDVFRKAVERQVKLLEEIRSNTEKQKFAN